MRKVLGLALAITALAAQLPRKAPEFVINTPDGKQLLLSSYRGKTVVLAFMFTTCTHCQHMAQVLSGVQKDYADKGVQVLGATFDPGAKTQTGVFNRIFATGFPCGYSTNEAVLHFLQQPETDPPFVPIVVFIDRSGTIRSVRMVTAETKPDSPEHKFFAAPETTVRAELDRMLDRATSAAARRTPPKS
jgi:peroxiredoxin